MKIFLIILSTLFFFSSCNQENVDSFHSSVNNEYKIFITKTTVGFNIYSNKGVLILEYTKRNCDSLTLSSLDDIYETALEFNNKELLKEKIDTTQLKVISYVTK